MIMAQFLPLLLPGFFLNVEMVYSYTISLIQTFGVPYVNGSIPVCSHHKTTIGIRA